MDGYNHSYLLKVDSSKHVSLQKSSSARHIVAGTNYLTKTGQAGGQGREGNKAETNRANKEKQQGRPAK
jgi:hypothetical protein